MKPNPSFNLTTSVASYTRVLLIIIALCSAFMSLYYWPTIAPRPYKSGTGTFNAGIWTVHFGIDNVGRDSQRRMRDVIRLVVFYE